MSVLASADVEDLSAAGLISLPSSNGTRRVHRRRLDRLSDEANSHLPLTPISSTASSSAVTEMYATVPELLFSLATLKYLGYTDTAANQIWDRWSNWPSTPPMAGRYGVDLDGEILFIEVAVSHVRRFRDQDTWDENDGSWFDFMHLCGINLETQTDIMDPIYKRMRLMGSCYLSVKDTIERRYHGLESIQRALRERTRAGTMRRAPGISPDSAFSSACRSAPQNNLDCIILYKGVDQARLDRFFDDSGAIIGWANMLSRSRTDFSNSQSGFIFTVHRDIAEYHACYAKRRDPVQSVAIMQITVPNHKIESLSSTQLQKTYWPSEDWKNLVWHCRRSEKLPSQLRKYKQALLTIGTIAKKPNRVYNAMDTFTQIDETCVLKTEDGLTDGLQYVFHDDEGQEFLEDLALAGSVTVHPVSGMEFTQWEREHSNFDK